MPCPVPDCPLPLLRALLLGAGLGAAAPAAADPCTDRLAALLGRPTHDGQPYEARSIGTVGGMAMDAVQEFARPEHARITPTQPPGMPQMLHHDGTAWQADGKGGWTIAWQTDKAEAERSAAATRAAQAAAVVSARCDSAELDGRTLDRIEGRVDPAPPFDGALDLRYWVDPASGLEVRIEQRYRTGGMDAEMVFDLQPRPGLVLPVP